MMYLDKFIASLKVNKNILREDKDVVLLPFGSEYSIYMKNLEGRTAVVNVSLDGKDVLGGNQLAIHPNQAVELEGFLTGRKVDAKFKFIQKTKQIQEHRGDRIDDGILRISFNYVKQIPVQPKINYLRSLGTLSRGIDAGQADMSWSTMDYSAPTYSTTDAKPSAFATTTSYKAGGLSQGTTPTVDEGITVRGSDSNQSFGTTNVGELETETHVIVLKLMGVNPDTNVVVEQPLTVKTKKECSTCGTVNKSSMKFCGQCGTRLD